MPEQEPFDVYVVSLSSSVARRAEFTARANNCGVRWTFFDALREPCEGMIYRPATARKIHGRVLLPQELGCYASNFNLWKMVVAGNRGGVVPEDDVIPDWTFLQEFLAIANRAAPSYLRLYSSYPAPFIRRGMLCGRHILEYLRHPFRTVAHYIDPRAAKRFLEHLAEVVRPVDDAMDRAWEHGVRNFRLFPCPVLERYGKSTIGDRRAPDQWSLRFQLARLPRRLAAIAYKELYFLGRRLSTK